MNTELLDEHPVSYALVPTTQHTSGGQRGSPRSFL
ncbi:hypothetical protein ACVWZX_005028 [Deinococcus sp. UYEF24]